MFCGRLAALLLVLSAHDNDRSFGLLEQDAQQKGTHYYGDPLPEGPLARMGTTRLRHYQLQAIGFFPLQEQSAREIIEQQDRASALLAKKLTKESMWEGATIEEDREKADSLRSYVKAAAIVRPKGLLPSLVKHLAYSPYLQEPLGLVGTEVQFPVVSAVIAYGLDAVPALINLLKEVDFKVPDNKERAAINAFRSRHLAITCLVDIYGKGGFGKELARNRISLEADKLDGQEKARLLHALKEGVLSRD